MESARVLELGLFPRTLPLWAVVGRDSRGLALSASPAYPASPKEGTRPRAEGGLLEPAPKIPRKILPCLKYPH